MLVTCVRWWSIGIVHPCECELTDRRDLLLSLVFEKIEGGMLRCCKASYSRESVKLECVLNVIVSEVIKVI